MRPLPNDRIEKYRIQPRGFESRPGTNWGVFMFQVGGVKLRVLSSGTDYENGWEHVSVSLEKRCPTWDEMCFVKDRFWTAEECVVQFHPPKSQHVNYHEYCLHLWKPLNHELIVPPQILVGPVKEAVSR